MNSDLRSEFPLDLWELRIFETSPSVSSQIDSVKNQSAGEGPAETHTHRLW